MQVTTITYQRVLNLGDFNLARLEKTALADEHEDHEVATQALIESVLRQLYEQNIHKQLDKDRIALWLRKCDRVCSPGFIPLSHSWV